MNFNIRDDTDKGLRLENYYTHILVASGAFLCLGGNCDLRCLLYNYYNGLKTRS